MALTVRPRLGRVAVGNQRSTHFKTANICLSVLTNCSDEKKVAIQRMMDADRVGGKQHRYQQVSHSHELAEARKAREARAINGVGGPCPEKKRILKIADPKERAKQLEDLRMRKLMALRQRAQGE